MKIGIITFHASHNYGSMLQAYALQIVLQQIGYDVEIINFRHEAQKKMFAHPLDIRRQGLLRVMYNILTSPCVTWMSSLKWKKYEDFMQQYLRLSKEYNSFLELKKAKLHYDLIITGSDQIWNTSCRDFDIAYFGTFIGDGLKKISYASSMGSNPEKKVNKGIVRKFCVGFDSISVREERTRRFLMEMGIHQNIAVTVDPTLLLDANKYDSLYDSQPIIGEKYIFYYDPFLKSDNLRIADRIGGYYEVPVVCDRYYKRKFRKETRFVRFHTNVGPSEFLNLVHNAWLVCGHSFHSIVFSILFKRDFLAIDGDKDSRMYNLLSKLGLEDRIISVENSKSFSHSHIENWGEVHARLAELCGDSYKWLRSAIDK